MSSQPMYEICMYVFAFRPLASISASFDWHVLVLTIRFYQRLGEDLGALSFLYICLV